jgi:tetratricopeptide (TPR) repeat protein
MLFDLRGRGRRRTVQIIYLSLAILMGGGLIFFGVGGSVSGGLFDALGIGGGSDSTTSTFDKQEQTLEKRVAANPQNAAAWAQLARVRYQIAGSGENYSQQTGQFTVKGKEELARVSQAWQRYLALDPKSPDANVASLMLQAYGPAGLNDPAKAAAAAEIVTVVRPSANSFFQLAVFAYLAGQTRKAELASKKALELTPKDQRATVKAQLDEAKKQAASAKDSTGAAGGSGAGATVTTP